MHREVKMRKIGEVTSYGNRYDWLHPHHGKFPDKIFLIKHLQTIFTCAVWNSEKIICMVEEDGCEYHSGYAQTYLWEIGRDEPTRTAQNGKLKLTPPSPDLLLQAAKSSIELYIKK